MTRTFAMLAALLLSLPGIAADPSAIRSAVSFYASFDDAVKGDVGGGALTPGTRLNNPAKKGEFSFTDGIDPKVFTIAKGKGIAGGALEPVDVLPENGRIYFPAKGNLAFKSHGWAGSVSVWCKTDPDTMLKTKFCDPVQITQKSAANGALWFDFNDAKPRDLRHGAFPAVPDGGKPIGESDPKSPMVRVPGVGWKANDWHHVVLTWQNLDTGKPDATTSLYIDGRLIGEVKDRPIAMGWDIDQAKIYVAINYLGLLDELACFDRALTADEVKALHAKPDLLQALKVKKDAVRPFRAKPQIVPATPKFPFDAATASRYQKAWAAYSGLPLELTNELGMKFVLVPPGTFLMGTPDEEVGRVAAYPEGPRHEVTLTEPFYLSKYEVTVGQFRKFVEAKRYVTDGEKNGGGNAHDARGNWKQTPGTNWKNPGYVGPYTQKDEHPVVHVSHTDALAFIRWLNETHLHIGDYTLPTEAQWEWACRAGTSTRYLWGDAEDDSGKVANVCDRSLKQALPDWPRAAMPMDDGHAFVAPVGSYRANAFGLHDMLGNVWEFCGTRYGPYSKDSAIDPGDGDPKRGFAVRGGGWSNAPGDCRSGVRNADPPNFCHSNLGFRVAIALPRFASTTADVAPAQQPVFTAGEGGYHTYRIPSLIATKKGTLLAFCEGRKKGRGDAGDIDLVLRRSFDGGRTWQPTQVVWDDADNTCGNPCPVVDPATGTIWLLLTHNLGADTEAKIVDRTSKASRTAWVSKSTDDGATWSKPVEITKAVKKPEWTWYATGPGVGIVTKSGRFVIPCDSKSGEKGKVRESHVIYSDDRGATWKLGGVVGPNCNECQVAELADGTLVLNMRSYMGNNRRLIAFSKDGGITWSKPVEDSTLIEPVCQGSVIGVPGIVDGLLFSNPASTKRENLTVRLSRDGGKTWPKSTVLHAGPAAYSCLAMLPGGEAACLYERGEKGAYETITFARFPLPE